MSSASGRTAWQKAGFIAGIVSFFAILAFFDFSPGSPVVTRMAAVAVLMAVWWITEAAPLFVTALLPIVLYPALGILKGKLTAPIYVNSIIFLFLGGFIIALAMEKHNLHKRIALWILRMIGGSPNRIILGFMLAAAFLSMWTSNTATAMMMVPIAMAIISRMEDDFGKEQSHGFTVALMLGIAYSCSIGGMATLVGTPPNPLFAQIFEMTFPEAIPITFSRWILAMLPISIVMLGVVWLLLTKAFFRAPAEIKIDSSIIEKEYRELGSMSFEEKAVMTVFSSAALLWIFRKKLELGFLAVPGWSQFIPYPGLIDDGTVALAMAILLFLIPAKDKSSGPAIIGPAVLRDLPWGIILLFGGGFALAKGFQSTGLSALIGSRFASLADVNPFLMVVVICFSLTFLTEFTSNTATTQIILPILASVGVAMQINPLFLMIPATVSASCAFMMPVATPPNAIVFGSGKVRIAEMARVGIVINLIGVMVIAALFYFSGKTVLGIDLGVFPDWAR